MDTVRKKLMPGAWLTVIETERFKTEYLALNFYLPLERQSAAETALLSRVLSRGTALHPDIRSLGRYTDMLYDLSCGISTSAIGDHQMLTVRMDMLSDRFIPKDEGIRLQAEALRFLVELLAMPLVSDGALSEEYTESEKKLLIDRIRGDINNKDRYAMKRGRMHMLGAHPAAISPDGDEETVALVTARQLCERLRSILGTAHLEAVYMGHLGADTEALIEKAIGDILPSQRPDTGLPRLAPFIPDGGEARAITEQVEAKQGRLLLGYSLPYQPEESAAASVFIELFGSSPMSRLFKNVRERLSLCYYCTAALELSLGTMWVRSGISAENLAAGTDEIARQLADIVAGNVTSEELEICKRSVISAHKSILDAPGALGEWYIRRLLVGADTDIWEQMKKVEAVTADEVSALAQRASLRMTYYLRGTVANS